VETQPGNRVRARGLLWDVLDVDRAANCERLRLLCVEGDMAGLEWDMYSPPERIEAVDARFDPANAGSLHMWRLLHRAHLLNEIPDGRCFAAREPGRVRVEPYQMVPLLRALDMPRPRLLLADGVGLGKTVQACLIAAELIARQRAHRILIVAPSGPLLRQWEQETRLRFGLRFTLVTNAAELWDLRRTHELGANPFDMLSLCLTSLDFAKQDYVLEELERSTWDLVIIDEAHHCVGVGAYASRENTWRRRLAEILACRCGGLLLLTATPHDGHDAHFASLIALLDPTLVDGSGNLVGRAYRRHVIRRMKIHIRDPRTGKPLFRPRHVIPVNVDVEDDRHEAFRDFHHALSAFVMPRLRRRVGGDDALAFISLLKRSASTTAACLETLRVVADRLAGAEQDTPETKAARRERARAMRVWRRRIARYGALTATEEANQTELEIEGMATSLRIEPDDVLGRLIQLGVMALAHDPRLMALIVEIRLIRLRHARANVLIYTEYTDSQIAAAQAIRSAKGIAGEVLTIGGLDDDDARAAAADRFTESDTLILISTDSLSEGLNLHSRCFHLIHLDLPYNPNRLEQRNGRLDRYGQREDPEIRYLYVPGTFEEDLLLHLIAKYERARATLDVMPDTLGVTADPANYGGTLIARVSEPREDLFRPRDGALRSLDRSAEDASPETVHSFIREIDRAFDSFDLMAVCHGWHGARGFNSGPASLASAEQSLLASSGAEDLADFVAAVVEAETHQPAIGDNQIRLPSDWLRDIEGLQGVDPVARAIHFVRDPEIWHDSAGQSVAFLGRAHPLVMRAIRRGCRLPGAVTAVRGEYPGLLLTFEIEIRCSGRVARRQVVAIRVSRDGSPVRVDQPLDPNVSECVGASATFWRRLFAPWTEAACSRAENLASQIASEAHEAFAGSSEASKTRDADRISAWLKARADQLCGPFVARTGDLFGTSAPGPPWREQEDAVARLRSFATDPNVVPAQRREVNDVLATFHEYEMSQSVPGPPTIRPIGMMMVVPRDVR
jgi:superfamily II DNA or RNA helicase